MTARPRSTLYGLVPALVGAGVRAPQRTIVAALLLTVLAGWFAAARFEMTTDTAALISPEVDWRRQERAAEAAFPQLRDAMLVVVDGATPEIAEDAAARLTAALAADHRHFRTVRRPDGGDFFAREGLLYASRSEVAATTSAMVKAQPLLGGLAVDPSLRGIAGAIGTMLDGFDRGETPAAALATPFDRMADAADAALAGRAPAFSWQRLFAGAGGPAAPTRRLILAQPLLDHGALMPGKAAGEAVAGAAAALGLDAAHGTTVRLTGEVPLADEEFATLQDNIGAVGAVMAAALLATLWFAVRSARLVAAIVLTVAAGLVVTTALGLAMVGRLNLISVAFIPLFVGLGVDFAIQLCVRFNAERATGLPADAAMPAAAAAMGPSLLLAAGAVVLGFGAFLPTAYVGIAELGLIAGVGMIVALVASVTLLPALVMLLGAGPPRGDGGLPALAGADRWLGERRRLVLWAFALALAASVALLPSVRFDFDPLHLRDPSAPAMRTLADLSRDPDRTPDTIDVLARSEAEARALLPRLAALPEVRQVVWLDSFVPDDQPAKRGAIADANLLLDLSLNPFDVAPPPDDAANRAALLAVSGRLRALPGSAPAHRLSAALAAVAAAPPPVLHRLDAGLTRPLGTMLDQLRAALTAQPVARATLPAEIARDWRTPDGRFRLSVYPRGNTGDEAAMRRFRRAVQAVTPAISGLPVATQAAAATVASAFVQAGVIAFVLVTLLLLAVLRDLREVLFTLAPVVLSIFLTLGTCVLIGQPINFANIIAFPLLFGVGVAFHIYFVMAWRAGAAGLLQSALARAVLFSALATGTAFGSLWLSRHPGTASMGKVLMLSLVWTLICALIFEPALLGPRKAGRS